MGKRSKIGFASAHNAALARAPEIAVVSDNARLLF
jgi:hypothetical protein